MSMFYIQNNIFKNKNTLILLFFFLTCILFSCNNLPVLNSIIPLLNNNDINFTLTAIQSTTHLATFELIQLSRYPLFFFTGIFFLISALVSLLFLSYLGLYGIFYLNFFSLFIFFSSFLPYIDLIFYNNQYFYIKCGKWFILNSNYKIEFDFLIDNISASFSLLTVSIAIFVYIYAFAYFRFEPLTDRLIMFLNLFIISMIFLVSLAVL